MATYQFVVNSRFAGMNGLDSEVHDALTQWGIDHSMKLAEFHFSKAFNPADVQRFIDDFFNDEDVRANFLLPDISGMPTRPLPIRTKSRFSLMHVQSTHLEGLMPAVSERFISGSNFKGRAPYKPQHLDISIDFEIDEALFDPDSTLYQILSEDWRSDLLCALFSVLRAGGALNQQSSNAEPYLTVTQKLYKLLVEPVRLETEDMLTLSHIYCYRILSLGDIDFFPDNPDTDLHPGNRCFLVINTLRRHITLFYNAVYV